MANTEQNDSRLAIPGFLVAGRQIYSQQLVGLTVCEPHQTGISRGTARGAGRIARRRANYRPANSTANHPHATLFADLADLACRGVQSPERAPAPVTFVAAACEPDGLLTDSRDDPRRRSAVGGVHDLVRPRTDIDDVEAHFPYRLVADRIWVPAQQLSVRVPEAVVCNLLSCYG